MRKQPYPYVQHSFKLSIAEEQRFAYAILKKYGKGHGNVRTAIREAVLQWIKRIETEQS